MKSNKKTFFDGNFDTLAWRFTLIFALEVPLVCTLFLSPAVGTLRANNWGDEVIFEILTQLSSLLASTAFLAQSALIICCLLARKGRLAWTLAFIEAISLVVIAVFLKRLSLLFTAWIDEVLLSEIGSFALSNYTLAHIHGEHPMAETSMLPAFLDVLALFFALGIGICGVYARIHSMKKRGRKLSADSLVSALPENKLADFHVAVTVIAMLAVQLLSWSVYVAGVVAEGGSPTLVSEYMFLILPYVYKISFAIVGYFVCQYVAYAMISRLGKK